MPSGIGNSPPKRVAKRQPTCLAVERRVTETKALIHATNTHTQRGCGGNPVLEGALAECDPWQGIERSPTALRSCR
jgi:hypothetical protein